MRVKNAALCDNCLQAIVGACTSDLNRLTVLKSYKPGALTHTTKSADKVLFTRESLFRGQVERQKKMNTSTTVLHELMMVSCRGVDLTKRHDV